MKISFKIVNSKTLSLIADILQILTFGYTLLVHVIPSLSKVSFNNPYLSIGITFIFLLLIISLINAIRKLIIDLVLVSNKILYNHTIQDQLEKRNEQGYLPNFEAIVPRKTVIQSLEKKVTKLAVNWSSDAYPSWARITIHIYKEIGVDLYIKYYSPNRKLLVNYYLTNLKLPRNKLPTIKQLERGKPVSGDQPFFYNKHWRSAILEVYRYLEPKITGKRFSISMDSWGRDLEVYILVSIDERLRNNKSFRLKGNILSEFISGKVIKQF